MSALARYLGRLDSGRKAALAAAGVLAVLVAAPSAESGQYGRRVLPVDSVRVARAFDDRASEHLSDLVDLARGLRRIDIGPRRDMSGAEQARKIQFSYLYEYANAPHEELKSYDKFFLEADRRAPEGREIDAIAEIVNAKKTLLIRGTTLVDEMAAALQREDYERAERIAYRFGEVMEVEGAALLQRRSRERSNPSLKEAAAEAVLGILSR